MSDLSHSELSARGGRNRWAGTTADERRAAMAAVQAKRKPGSKRQLTDEQRAEIGRRLAAARAAKRLQSVKR